jgi:thiazole/oxazole-forming peptide maturase SagD family component
MFKRVNLPGSRMMTDGNRDQPCNLVFGEKLLLPEAVHIRQKLLKLALGLRRIVYVDSLLNAYFKLNKRFVEYASFLLFDFHRIYIYNELPSTVPQVHSVIRAIMDDCQVKPFELLQEYAEQPSFHFLYSTEILDVLPFLWETARLGTLVTLDLTNGEIRMAKPWVHPESARVHVEKNAADCPSTVDDRIVLKDCTRDQGLRVHDAVPLDDLVSPDVGIIRAETMTLGPVSVANALVAVAAGPSIARFVCSGRSTNSSDALFAARCEAIERHQVNFMNPRSSLVYESYEHLKERAIDPETLFFSQVHRQPSGSRPVYHSELPMYWTWAQETLSGRAFLVPAQEVWFNTNSLHEENLCIHGTTNGCAVGRSIEEAGLFALLEAIERDAFITMWYLRRPSARIPADSVASKPFQMVLALIETSYGNYKTEFFDVTTEVGIPVVLGLARKQYGSGPQLILGAACRLTCEEAMFAALQDISTRLNSGVDTYNEKRARHFLQHPEAVVEPSDHATLYSLKETCERLSFLNDHPCEKLDAASVDSRVPMLLEMLQSKSCNLKSLLEAILCKLDSVGIRVLFKDLTYSVVADKGLFCVKAITPGLYPMWFGYYNARFAITRRLERLSLDFVKRRLIDKTQINLELHPFD